MFGFDEFQWLLAHEVVQQNGFVVARLHAEERAVDDGHLAATTTTYSIDACIFEIGVCAAADAQRILGDLDAAQDYRVVLLGAEKVEIGEAFTVGAYQSFACGGFIERQEALHAYEGIGDDQPTIDVDDA